MEIALWPRVELAMDLAEAVAGDVGIDFGGADAGVAEQFLDNAQIGAVLQKMRGETMSKHVRSHVAFYASAADASFYAQPKSDRGKGSTAFGEKHIGGGALVDEFGPAHIQVELQGSHGLAAQGHDALFIAFADYVNKTGLQMELLQARLPQFRQAQAGSIGQLQHGLITQAGGGFGGLRREEVFDLPTGPGLWQARAAAGQRKVFGEVGREQLFAFRKTIKRSQGGNLQINTFAAEPLRRILGLIGQSTLAFVLQESHQMPQFD